MKAPQFNRTSLKEPSSPSCPVRRCGAWLLPVVILLAASPSPIVAGEVHAWYGTSATSGYWSVAANWKDSATPDGRSGEALVFMPGGSLLVNTNDLLHLPPATHVSFDAININDGGYSLHGNPVNVAFIEARYPLGAEATINFDIHGGASVTVYTNSATLNLKGNLILTNGGLYLGGLGDVEISGFVSGTGAVTKVKGNTGDLTLSGFGANTYSGDTVVRDGTLRLDRYRLVGMTVVGATAVPGDLAIGVGTNGVTSAWVELQRDNQIANTAVVTVAGSGLLDLNDQNDTIGDLVLVGGDVRTGAGVLTVAGNVSALPGDTVNLMGNLNLGTSGTRVFTLDNVGKWLAVNAAVSGGSGATLRKRGLGTLGLNGSNSFAGPVIIEAGGVDVYHPLSLGGTAAGTVLAALPLEQPQLRLRQNLSITNETLTVSNSIAVLSTDGLSTWRGPVILMADLTATTGATANELRLDGVLSGAGGLRISGLGNVLLEGTQANTFTGPCSVYIGTLELAKTAGLNAIPGGLVVGDGTGGAEADVVVFSADHQIADPGAVEIAASGFLDLAGHDEVIGQLTGSGAVNLGSGMLTVNNRTGHTFSGNIRGGRAGFGGGDVAKDGPGRWTLSGSNTYWGKTYVSDGTLLVNGTIANSDILIAGSGTLGGTGTVQNINVTGLGGTVAPGTSAGRLTAQGAVVLTNATFEAELNGRAAGAEYDQLVTDQAPVLGDGHRNGNLNVLVGFAPPAGSTFTIVSNRSSSPVSGTFNGKGQNATFAAAGWLFQISYTGGSGNDVVLTRVVAPAASNFVASASSGQLQLAAQGFANAAYVLEAATNLNDPILWQPIQTNMANGTGLVQFTDPDLPVNTQRFYRIASP